MRKKLAIVATLFFGMYAHADAPAPYPITVNSRAQTAPPVTVYRAAEAVLRVTFADGDTASDLTGAYPFMAWATNASAAVVSTAAVSVVAGSTGVVDFTFSPSSVNYAAGSYLYEVGVKSGTGSTRIYRQGKFNIFGSPYAGGAGAVNWSTDVNWNLVNWINLPNYMTNVPPQSYTIITNSPWAHETNTASITITNGLASTSYVASAIAAIPEPFTVRDSTDTNRWWRFEGTQAVQYALGALTTNYTVTLSTNFSQVLVGSTRPAWTNNVWPFVDGVWEGTNTSGSFVLNWNGAESNPGAQWIGAVADWNDNPLVTLSPNYEAVGTATVYQHVYYPTNATGNVLGPVPTNLVSDAKLLAWWVETGFAQIAASNALPYTAWTGTVTPADGTATVAIAHGNMPVLVTGAPCVLTLDPTGYGTAGVSRVSLSYYPGINSFTFATNIIDYAATPTVDTNGWNTLLIRRVSNGAWKGVGL